MDKVIYLSSRLVIKDWYQAALHFPESLDDQRHRTGTPWRCSGIFQVPSVLMCTSLNGYLSKHAPVRALSRYFLKKKKNRRCQGFHPCSESCFCDTCSITALCLRRPQTWPHPLKTRTPLASDVTGRRLHGGGSLESRF